VKLKSFQVINCFGFRDSGQINLDTENNVIYLLGRNSSGKSSVLNGIKYFESGVTPSQQPNFKNFNDSGTTSALVGTYRIRERKLSEDQFKIDLIKELARSKIDEQAMKSNAKLKTLFTTVLSIYSLLIERINEAEEVIVWKLDDGHYHYLESTNNEYNARIKEMQAAINAAKERDGNFNVMGTMTRIPMTWNTFEDLLFLQTPKIYLFNEKFSLREVLPERIDVNWAAANDKFLNTFVDYLGKEKIDKYLASNDPEEREELLLELRTRAKALTDKVNQYGPSTPNSDLLDITLHDKNGVQITVRTDGKKSYYTHISDNTKFLFAYYLYQETNNIKSDILLFDEPSNGFHPTAQTFILNFLKQLAVEGNSVIIATHSEHLIDLDLLAGVRLMSTDENKNIIVKNHFYNQAKQKGDYLALQPILDAIGYRYGNQLNIKDKVIMTEGVTDLLYLRAFNKILGSTEEIDVAPARGDGTILNVIPLLVSQGINFKIVIDTGTVKQKIQSVFGVEDKFIFEVPIPPNYAGKMTAAGIEDLFSKTDFKKRLLAIGHTPSADYNHVGNNHYMKTSGAGAKRLVAQRFYETAPSFSESDFEMETVESFSKVLKFCSNSDWYSL
jgi:predicted ATP-dependent endonuclease of OLD family